MGTYFRVSSAPMTERKLPHELVVALQSRMFANRIKPVQVCRRANVAPSTWTRWSEGGTPNLDTLAKMDAALDALIAEASSAAA
jgi:hypothetical protein